MQKDTPYLNIYPEHGRKVVEARGIHWLIYKLLPRHIVRPLEKEIYMALVRLITRNARKRFIGAKDLLVNIGAGDTGKIGWVNVDILRFKGVNCVYDCRKRLPFPDDSVRGIFCEHFLEHLDYTEEVPYFLSECHRVLKTGGVLRVIVPDLEEYLRAYCDQGWEHLSRIRPLDADRRDFYYKCKYNTRMELINLLFRQGDSHKFAYDYETVEFLLHRYGFSAVQRQKFGTSLMAELCIDLPERASESLYVEAIK